MPPFTRHVPFIASSGAAVFDPASLSLTYWNRANSTTGYVSGTFLGVASAGGSGSRDGTEGTNPPAVGAALNGHNTADFDGTNDQLANATAISTLLTASAWRAWVLFNADAIATDSATAYLNDPLMRDTGGFWGFHLRSNGGSPLLYAYQWDGAEKKASASVSTGAWTLAQARYDGTNIRLQVNSGAVQTAAAGSISTTTGTLMLGREATTPLNYNGRIADVGLVASAGADSDFTDIKAYVNARYGLAL